MFLFRGISVGGKLARQIVSQGHHSDNVDMLGGSERGNLNVPLDGPLFAALSRPLSQNPRLHCGC